MDLLTAVLPDSVELILLEVEDQIVRGEFNREKAVVFTEKMKDFFFTCDESALNILLLRMTNIAVMDMESPQCYLSCLRFIFHVSVSTHYTDEMMFSMHVLSGGVANKIIVKIDRRYFEKAVVPEWMELCRECLSEDKLKAALFISTIVIGIVEALHPHGELPDVYKQLLVLQSKAIDVKAHPDRVIRKSNHALLQLSNHWTEVDMKVDLLRMQSEAFLQKGETNEATKRAERALQIVRNSETKSNLEKWIKNLEEKKAMEEKEVNDEALKEIENQALKEKERNQQKLSKIRKPGKKRNRHKTPKPSTASTELPAATEKSITAHVVKENPEKDRTTVPHRPIPQSQVVSDVAQDSGSSHPNPVDQCERNSEEHDNAPKPPDKTWLEESEDVHNGTSDKFSIFLQNEVKLKREKSQKIPPWDPFYDPELPESLMHIRMKEDRKRFRRCVIHLISPQAAVCRPTDSSETKSIDILGRSNIGRTFHEDVVCVEIQEESKDGKEKQLFGKVVGVLERTRHKDVENPVFLCTVDDDEAHLMKPICSTVPKINTVHDRVWKKYPNTKNWFVELYDVVDGETKFKKFFPLTPEERKQYLFSVVYISWSSYFPYAKGVVVDVIQCTGNYEQCLKIMDKQHNVSTIYPEDVVKLTKELTKSTPPLPGDVVEVFTIDPINSRDLDDALNVRRVSEDEYEVGVHIADVASVVTKGDKIDQEAKKRAVTFYPEQWRPVHMLPETLSQDRCSLLEGQRRRAISVYFTVEKHGKVLVEPRIARSVVRSNKQLTYEQAQSIIDRKEQNGVPDDIKDQIQILYELSKSIRKQRLRKRHLSVDLPKDFHPGELSPYCEESYQLVEEFMILANSHVAKVLHEKYPSVPVRYQEMPDKESLVAWFEKYQNIGHVILKIQDRSCDRSDGRAVLSLDEGVEEKTPGYVTVQKTVWEQIVKRIGEKDYNKAKKLICMDDVHPTHYVAQTKWNEIMEAAHYACGAKTNIDISHYSLEIEHYTHFTSPIRRYIDLVVHRFLHAYLDHARDPPYSQSEIGEICIHINERTKAQKLYQKQSKQIQLAIQLKHRPEYFQGFISESNDDVVQMEIPKWKYLPRSCKEIPFHSIDVCESPEVRHDSVTGNDVTKTTWRKRIYNTLGVESDCILTNPKDSHDINPNQDIVYLKISTWARLVHSVVGSLDVGKGNSTRRRCRSDAKTKVDSLGRDGEKPPVLFGTYDQVSCEVWRERFLKRPCRFSFTFAPGRILTAQMSSCIENGLPTPKISLVHVTKSTSFCLEHKENPVPALAPFCYESLKVTSWPNLEKYVKSWLDVIEMESAVTSSHSDDSTIFIDNVKLVFTKGTCGYFTLGETFCRERHLLAHELQIIRDKKSAIASDFLCVRCPPNMAAGRHYMWVGHGKMTSVAWEKKQFIIEFRLLCKGIPPDIRRAKTSTVQIEILPISELYRKLLTCFTVEEISKVPLAQAIALNEPVPKLDEAHYGIGKKAERDLEPDQLRTNRLPGNNEAQHKAIDKALTSSFTLIQGPPGTGKTYTGIKIAYLFTKINRFVKLEASSEIPKHRVMYCGPSNKSVDVVARNLKRKLNQLCPKIIRVYGSMVVDEDFPKPGQYIPKSRHGRENRCPRDLRDISLHHVIRQKGKPFAEQIKNYDSKFLRERKSPNSTDVDSKTIEKYQQLVNIAELAELQNYEIILCTAAVAGSRKFSEMNIYQCIIDECGMCTEPECMLPIIRTKAKQVVLIGDHKQLRPIILCSEAAKLGLERSLFERYSEQAVFLNRQYRMHVKICEFPSKEFYGGRLETGDVRNLHLPVRDNEVTRFYHIEGEEEYLTVHTEEGHERSKSNRAEADKVRDLYLCMVEKWNCNPKSINVMTQYKSQVSLLQKSIPEYNVDVNTVVASQGGEWDYVILSTVRSQAEYNIERAPTYGWNLKNLGFITDRNQINVALTRARKGLFIIGNKNLLKCDEVWGRLLEHYKERGCIFDASVIPRARRPPR